MHTWVLSSWGKGIDCYPGGSKATDTIFSNVMDINVIGMMAMIMDSRYIMTAPHALQGVNDHSWT